VHHAKRDVLAFLLLEGFFLAPSSPGRLRCLLLLVLPYIQFSSGLWPVLSMLLPAAMPAGDGPRTTSN
jgi:hypothetical protein